MRFAFLRIAAVGCFCALAAMAQQPVSVSKVLEFVTTSVSQKTPDSVVAGALSSMKLTEKLDTKAIENLQLHGAGPRTIQALTRLAAASANLAPPAPQTSVAKVQKLPPPPSAEEQVKILNEAREYALNYTKNLPDFICLEVTLRYYDRHYQPGTEGTWAQSDKLAEKLTYYDQQEKYELISQNGDSLLGKSSDSVGGALSRNDFGTLMREVFSPESAADFRWERWTGFDKKWMNVYTFKVDQPHSRWTLDYHRQQKTTPAYHGEVFVEQGTNVIWRITIDPEPAPSFPMQDVHETLDYRYTDVGGQQFVLPKTGELIMRADGIGTKNNIEFRAYKKYSADTTITFDDADDKTAPAGEKK